VQDPCALTAHHAMKSYLGSEGIAPHILDLGIMRKLVAKCSVSCVARSMQSMI
jgi:hypothetical protein